MRRRRWHGRQNNVEKHDRLDTARIGAHGAYMPDCVGIDGGACNFTAEGDYAGASLAQVERQPPLLTGPMR